MIYFHIRSWSTSSMYNGIMCKDGTCFVFDKYDKDYNPLSVEEKFILELILDKNCGSIEFGADSVDKYVDMFPEIKEYNDQMGGVAEQHLYIQLLLARLPAAEYEMGLLLEIYREPKGKIYCLVSYDNRFGSFIELENLGYVDRQDMSNHKNPAGYYFSLTDKGRALVEKHLHP